MKSRGGNVARILTIAFKDIKGCGALDVFVSLKAEDEKRT